MQTLGLDRLVIMVRDMDKALQFYSGALGMRFHELDADISKRDGVRSCVCHQTHIHLISPILPLPENAAPPMRKKAALLQEQEAFVQALTFRVDDPFKAGAELEAQGLRIQHRYEKSHDYASVGLDNFEEVVLDDADTFGLVIGLANYDEPSAPPPLARSATIEVSGMDRVIVMVRDMDKALDLFSRKLGMAFMETDKEVQKKAGNRGCVCLDSHVHMVQPNTPVPDDAPPPIKQAAELLRGRESLVRVVVYKTEDSRADAERMRKAGFSVIRSWEDDHDYASVGIDNLYEYLFDPRDTLGMPVVVSQWDSV